MYESGSVVVAIAWCSRVSFVGSASGRKEVTLSIPNGNPRTRKEPRLLSKCKALRLGKLEPKRSGRLGSVAIKMLALILER